MTIPFDRNDFFTVVKKREGRSFSLPSSLSSSSFRVAFASPGEVEGKMEIRRLEGSGRAERREREISWKDGKYLKFTPSIAVFVLFSCLLIYVHCVWKDLFLFLFFLFPLVSSETSSFCRSFYQYFMDIETKFIEYVCSFQDVKCYGRRMNMVENIIVEI